MATLALQDRAVKAEERRRQRRRQQQQVVDVQPGHDEVGGGEAAAGWDGGEVGDERASKRVRRETTTTTTTTAAAAAAAAAATAVESTSMPDDCTDSHNFDGGHDDNGGNDGVGNDDDDDEDEMLLSAPVHIGLISLQLRAVEMRGYGAKNAHLLRCHLMLEMIISCYQDRLVTDIRAKGTQKERCVSRRRLRHQHGCCRTADLPRAGGRSLRRQHAVSAACVLRFDLGAGPFGEHTRQESSPFCLFLYQNDHVTKTGSGQT